MSSLTDTAEAALLDLLFLNANWANIGDATGLRGATSAGSLYISLHTADPGEAGAQDTSELTYTGYARVAVARSGSGFSRTVSTISNVSTVAFGQCTAGSETATHFGIGTSASGAGGLILKAPLTAALAISAGITPSFAAGQLTAAAA